jgi:hypothetical protein
VTALAGRRPPRTFTKEDAMRKLKLQVVLNVPDAVKTKTIIDELDNAITDIFEDLETSEIDQITDEEFDEVLNEGWTITETKV